MAKNAKPKRDNDRDALPDHGLRDGAHLDGLGEALRQHYEEMKSEPIPERLQALIAQMHAEEAGEDD